MAQDRDRAIRARRLNFSARSKLSMIGQNALLT
jgi:hypothetical protein